MKRLRIFIVDDERLVRADLRAMLAEHENVDIVGEAANVDSAIEQLGKLNVDAVLLDIQMPQKSGFELLPHIPQQTHVVFVTAFDSYAVRAFEVNSLDYLLKPVSPERLAQTMRRLGDVVAEQQPTEGIMSISRQQLAYTDRLYVQVGRNRRFVALANVLCIRAADAYSEIVVSQNERYLEKTSLQAWEKLLPKEFMRIHRATIVNTSHIFRVFDGIKGMQVFLNGLPQSLPMSRRYSKIWRERL
jgi:two-component system LytT family response regulator